MLGLVLKTKLSMGVRAVEFIKRTNFSSKNCIRRFKRRNFSSRNWIRRRFKKRQCNKRRCNRKHESGRSNQFRTEHEKYISDLALCNWMNNIRSIVPLTPAAQTSTLPQEGPSPKTLEAQPAQQEAPPQPKKKKKMSCSQPMSMTTRNKSRLSQSQNGAASPSTTSQPPPIICRSPKSKVNRLSHGDLNKQQHQQPTFEHFVLISCV
ncbi:hypothetical protein LIER_12426 [Lithospermum erythrorhizon]|uniref:Uncharacterized protein n=1 Tax=Lithospermum erythrorhizon TaxID=34254 RepID=A0AAV3PTI9_LITER